MAEWDGTGEACAASFEELTRGAAESLLAAVTARVPRGDLLDVGTGTGVLAGAASVLGYRVRATEPEASMRAVLRHAHPDVAADAAGLPDLPYGDGSLDAVTAGFVLSHVDDPRASARELARVPRVGGVVAATIWPAGASPLRPQWKAASPRSAPSTVTLPRTRASACTKSSIARPRRAPRHPARWSCRTRRSSPSASGEHRGRGSRAN